MASDILLTNNYIRILSPDLFIDWQNPSSGTKKAFRNTALLSNKKCYNINEDHYYSYFREPFINKIIKDYHLKRKTTQNAFYIFWNHSWKVLRNTIFRNISLYNKDQLSHLYKKKNGYLRRKLLVGTKCF